MAVGCPGHARHWFTTRRQGVRTPYCIRCKAPNPRWTTADQEAWDDFNNPDPRQWVRCYEIGDDVDERGRAWCPKHERRYERDVKADGPHHLVLEVPNA